ncbi:MAG: M56 family metallopeptidase [Saprospiraceae bacterium]|nr:M56 family metallopeptidase [Saprospiraceae bacterium]
MNAIPVDYLLRLSIIWGALLLYYRFFLAQNHNWQLRRVYLFSTYLLGIIIPLLPALEITQLPEALPDFSVIPNFTFEPQGISLEVTERTGPSWWLMLPILYGLGVAFQLGLFVKNSWQIWRWKQVGEQHKFGRYAIIEHHSIPSPFAGWRTIFLPPRLDAELQSVACLHEAAHLHSHHNLERLPLVLGQIFFWFHPLQWYYNRALATVQEYQADEAVLQHIPTKTYGHILIQQSMRPTHQWQAGLFASPLKQRINMMVSQKNKQPWRLPQMGLFLGLLGLLVFSCSDFASAVKPDSEEIISYLEADQVPILVTSQEAPPEKSPFNKVILENIYRNIKYPKAARQHGLTGFVLAKFVIDENGKLHELRLESQEGVTKKDFETVVVTGYSAAKSKGETGKVDMAILAQEVERVISELPDWKPALKDGKPVPVTMDMGVVFRLEG